MARVKLKLQKISKSATLNPNNWVKLYTKNGYIMFKHKKRSYVKLQYDPLKKIGLFMDSRNQQIISELKNIKWK